LGRELYRAAVGRLTPRLPGIDSFFQRSRHDAFLSLQLRRLSCLILSFRARGAGPSGMGGWRRGISAPAIQDLIRPLVRLPSLVRYYTLTFTSSDQPVGLNQRLRAGR